jgi:hypothetical protein
MTAQRIQPQVPRIKQNFGTPANAVYKPTRHNPRYEGRSSCILNSVIEHHPERARTPAYKSSAIAKTATTQIKKLKTFISCSSDKPYVI